MDGTRKASESHQDRTFRFLVAFTPRLGTKNSLFWQFLTCFMVINVVFLHVFQISYSTRHKNAQYRHKNPLAWYFKTTYSTRHVFAWYRHKNLLFCAFKITKRSNLPKKSISVPENLSIYILECIFGYVLQILNSRVMFYPVSKTPQLYNHIF